jgi:hypothetical protein
MSGGSMQYLYSLVRDADFRLDTPLRRAFHRHLQLVAEALHAIEWVDSGDSGPGDEEAAILACIPPMQSLSSAMVDAEEAMVALQTAIERARGDE